MIRRIAIFRALNLGDMLCIIPSVRAIRKAHPHAEIFLVGLQGQEDFVRRFSHYFNHLIKFPGWPGLPEQPFNTTRIVQFLQNIRTYEFDLVLQMHGNGVITNSLCMLWDGKKVAGLGKEGEYVPDKSLFPPSPQGEHEILRFFKILDSLGIPHQGTHLEFPIADVEMARFDQIARQSGIRPQHYICLHPGARDIRRRWPVDNFAVTANKIADQGYTLVLTGSMEEKDLLKALQERIDAPVINVVERYGHLSAGELASVLKHARLLVSNDTGVSHIAAALNLSSVILFSACSDIRRWRPLNDKSHTAIPYEKSKDLAFVLRCIMNKLEETNEKEKKSPFLI